MSEDSDIRELEEALDDTEDELYESISIQKFFQERFENRESIERAIIMHKYIQEKFGINSFQIYLFVLEYIIKNSGIQRLEQDLDSIISGNRFNALSGKKESSIMNTLIRATEDMLSGLLEPEPEPIKKLNEKPKREEKSLLKTVFEVYSALRYPEHHKEFKRKEKIIKFQKERKEEKKLLEGFRIIDNVFGVKKEKKLQPKPQLTELTLGSKKIVKRDLNPEETKLLEETVKRDK